MPEYIAPPILPAVLPSNVVPVMSSLTSLEFLSAQIAPPVVTAELSLNNESDISASPPWIVATPPESVVAELLTNTELSVINTLLVPICEITAPFVVLLSAKTESKSIT